MHRVEIRLTHEGDDPSANFELYSETLKDGKYTELAPMRAVASGSAPIVTFLEANERIVIVAKGDTGRLVFDKEQNANIRVETEAEIKDREQREANLKKAHVQQVRAATTPPKPVASAPTAPIVTPVPKPSTPASATQGPIDSKQVKR